MPFKAHQQGQQGTQTAANDLLYVAPSIALSLSAKQAQKTGTRQPTPNSSAVILSARRTAAAFAGLSFQTAFFRRGRFQASTAPAPLASKAGGLASLPRASQFPPTFRAEIMNCTIGTLAQNMRGVGQYGGQSPESLRYNLHHFSCPHCQAAGRLTQGARRCDIGLPLWQAYLQSVVGDLVTANRPSDSDQIGGDLGGQSGAPLGVSPSLPVCQQGVQAQV